jgi:HEAT repeat protein
VKKILPKIGVFIIITILAGAAYVIMIHDRHQAGESSNAPVSSPNISSDVAETPPNPPAPTDFSKSTASLTETLSNKDLKELLKQFYSYRQNPNSDAVLTLSSFLDHTNLDHTDRIVVLEAIDTLTHIALENDDQRETVFKILQAKAADESFEHRDRALFMAALLGKDRMLPIVANLINNPDDLSPAESYDVASRALRTIGGQESVPYLRGILAKAQDLKARRNCYEALARIETPEALSILEKEVLSSEGNDQTAGAVALARLNNPEVINFMADSIQAQEFSRDTIAMLSYSVAAPEIFGLLLNSKTLTEEKKIDLLETLANHSVDGNDDLRVNMTIMLVQFMEASESPQMKIHAIKVIGELGEQSAPEILQPYLKADEPDVRKAAFFSFVDYITPENYSELKPFLWDEDQDIRRTAMNSLGRFVSYDDIDILKKAAQHKDEFIRKYANALLDQVKQ